MAGNSLRRTAAAAVAPFACAAHCAAMPLLAAFMPALAPFAAGEAILMVATAAVVGWVLARGTLAHGRRRVWVPAAGGSMLWAAALIDVAGPVPELAVVVGGSVMFSVGALWNAHLSTGSTTCRSDVAPGLVPARAPRRRGMRDHADLPSRS
jgi:hypothetical protein